MKNLTKPILILMFCYSLFNSAAFGQSGITVFNQPVMLHSLLKKNEFPSGYAVSIGASHLRDCAASRLRATDLRAIYDATANLLVQPNTPAGNPVLGAFFTTQYDNDTVAILQNKTHGLCFGFYSDSTLTLYYYEVNPEGKFALVNNLVTGINAIAEDIFISLHYSHFSIGSFPDKSTIFRFVCDSIGRTRNEGGDLSISLSKDYRRQSGLFSLGMADSSVLAGLEYPNAGSSNCGAECIIHQANSTCAYVADMAGYFIYTCRTDMGHCAAGAIERRARESNIVFGVPVKFKKMRNFRDTFMSKYCEGRKYTGYYYAFSKYVKLGIAMLWKYAAILPELYTAMDNLADETSDKIIVTSSLKEKVLEILQDHKDVGDSYFQSILNEVAADMEAFEGLKRSELIALMTPYGNCNGERKAFGENDQMKNYFASVTSDEAHDEFAINYSISGSRMWFELFSTTSRLVATLTSPSSKQKIYYSTTSLSPGVYIYRIRSDAGYEKVGKVVIVR